MTGGSPSYETRLAEVESFLASKHAIVLATSEGDRVTARTVTFASRGVDVYFLSFAGNTKCRQIKANPNVALCRDHVQIEGTAEILGRAGNSADAAAVFRAKYGDDFERHVNHPAMVAIRVRPLRIAFFYMEGERFLVDRLDVVDQTMVVERLDETAPSG